MRTFDQLNQDEQMFAVDEMVDNIINSIAEGFVPDCFIDFSDEIEAMWDEENDDEFNYLADTIGLNQAMKVAMLHQAGEMAKRAIYLEDGDITVRLS
jgi:hypothetical protein